LLTLKGMVAVTPGEFTDQLKAYNPPLFVPEPKKEPDKKEPEKKEPEPKP
jgi:hypothetical protein